jgi:hypothetical protein
LEDSLKLQESETMYSIDFPGLLATLLVFAILLIVLGLWEKSNPARKRTPIRIGMMLIGIVILLTGFLWYVSLATIYIPLPIYMQDIVLLTLFSAVGGVVIGVALVMKGN